MTRHWHRSSHAKKDTHSKYLLQTTVSWDRDDDEANARCMPIWVMKFDVGKWMYSHEVPHKGTGHFMVSQEIGRCDGSERISKDHPENRQ